MRTDIESAPRIEQESFGTLLVLFSVAVLATLLLVAGIATGWRPLLIIHFVSQFILVLIAGSILRTDIELGTTTQVLWAGMFLLLAPLSVPAYLASFLSRRLRKSRQLVRA